MPEPHQKICPMMIPAKQVIEPQDGMRLCQGDKCAWWLEKEKLCAMVHLTKSISDIADLADGGLNIKCEGY